MVATATFRERNISQINMIDRRIAVAVGPDCPWVECRVSRIAHRLIGAQLLPRLKLLPCDFQSPDARGVEVLKLREHV